jgi:hypothetical protein
MSYVVTSVRVRPNTGVAWYSTSDGFKSYVTTNFTDRGTRTSTSKSVSDDGLTQTIVTSYPNEAAWNTFKTDLEVVNAFNTRKTYYTDNNITITITKTES